MEAMRGRQKAVEREQRLLMLIPRLPRAARPGQTRQLLQHLPSHLSLQQVLETFPVILIRIMPDSRDLPMKSQAKAGSMWPTRAGLQSITCMLRWGALALPSIGLMSLLFKAMTGTV